MKSIEEILSNIKSIAYFLASKEDIDANIKLRSLCNDKKIELDSDIVDLKLRGLQYYLDTLNKEFNGMKKTKVNKIKLCVASSNSLKEEREAIESYLFMKNDKLIEDGIYLSYNVWEKQPLRFNQTKKQEDFNKALVYESDIFICLIGDNVGEFTKEEFIEAKNRFSTYQKPYVMYVYFKDIQGKETSFYETDGWKKRIELKNYIQSELQQVVGIYTNKAELIMHIDHGIEGDIRIVQEKLEL